MKAKTKIQRLLGIMLALVMLVGLMPTTALAEETATADFSTDPTTALGLLNAAKTDGAEDSTWDADSKTLTLNGVNFETSAVDAVKLPGGTTIVLNGENTITGGNSASEGCYGIYAEGSLTIQGTGTLNVTGGNTTGTAAGSRSCGIYTDQALTISGGTVKAYGGATYKASLGIYSKNNINISGTADVTAIGGTATGDGSFGINAEGEVIISGGEVKATGGTGKGSDGIYSGISKVTINGGTVMAIGGVATGGGWSVGIYAHDGRVNISGGTVTSAADYNSSDYYTFKGSVTGNDIKTISFNSNGGSGKRMVAKISGETYTLPENVFTAPSNKVFKGWKVGSEIKAVGGEIDADDSTIVYAQWGDVEYAVTVTGGTASPSKAAAGTTVTLNANKAPDGQVFDKWVAESGNVTFANANSATTTFTMPAGNVSVEATYAIPIPSVAITGIDAPVANTELATEAVCGTTGVSTAAPAVTWDTSDSNAGYYKAYTASVTLSADTGYKFADGVTATVNGKPATSAQKNANGTLTVTYTFPKTDKHNIEITVNTAVRGGDAATNPTISSGYEFGFCFFVEDTDGDGDFTNDRTLVVDKVLLDAFLEEEEMTFEEFQSALRATIKTKFTGGCTYSVYAYITHSDGAYFDSDDYDKVTNAIIKLNNEDITDNCLAYDEAIAIMPGTCVFTASSADTYTGGGGGGSKVTTNTVTADSVKNGDVAISPKYAAKGTIVTLKIEPDKGYKLDTVTVTDKNGNKIELTDKGNGEYTFKMPATKVNVETTFVEETTTEDNTMMNFFVDIPDDAYYYDAVLWAAKNGITGGMDDTHFAPDITCTRVQAITFLWRAAGSPMPKSSEISFEDIETDSYYYYAVLWALENGITSGTSATTFRPDDTCNRGQIVTFLWRSEKSPTVGMDNTFTDVSSDSYYADATNWAAANGITNGTSDTTFSPDETCTRGQIVTLLYRFFVK